MLDDMRMRKLAPQTQALYLRGVERLAKYLGRSPDQADAEDLRRFQLHLVEQGVSSRAPCGARSAAARALDEISRSLRCQRGAARGDHAGGTRSEGE